MGIIAGIIEGLFGGRYEGDPYDLAGPSLNRTWQRDRVERGGSGPGVEDTRAAATLQAENQSGIQNRYDAVTERGREANPDEDRRDGGDRRGIF